MYTLVLILILSLSNGDTESKTLHMQNLSKDDCIEIGDKALDSFNLGEDISLSYYCFEQPSKQD